MSYRGVSGGRVDAVDQRFTTVGWVIQRYADMLYLQSNGTWGAEPMRWGTQRDAQAYRDMRGYGSESDGKVGVVQWNG